MLSPASRRHLFHLDLYRSLLNDCLLSSGAFPFSVLLYFHYFSVGYLLSLGFDFCIVTSLATIDTS